MDRPTVACRETACGPGHGPGDRVGPAALPVVDCGTAAATGQLVTSRFVETSTGRPCATGPGSRWTIDVGSSAENGWRQPADLHRFTRQRDARRPGRLVIRARRDGGGYTSADHHPRESRLPFGTIVARMKLPAGQGLVGVLMLGAKVDTVGGHCGEIDIRELINDATRYHVALHGPGWTGSARAGADLSADFPTTG